MNLIIRSVTPDDKAGWAALYQGYADFYGVAQTQEMRDTVWSWLMDSNHPVSGLVCAANGALVGLTHYRPFHSPLTAQTRGFLDDLYVDPDARGSGAAEALIDAVSAVGRKNGWAMIRWITADDNYRARSLYDRKAARTPWITYDIKL